MPKIKTDYSKTLIYKIVCKDLDIKDCYVGHTTNWIKRKSSHKSNCNNQNKKDYNLNVYKFIRENGNWDNWEMIEIKKYPCNDKREAEAEERTLYEELNSTLNTYRPFITEDEKKQQKKEIKKKYYEKNKEKFKEFYIDYYEEFINNYKNYYKENKDDKLEYQKNYNEKNKDEIKDYQKNYRQCNNDTSKKKINCECGGKYTHANISIHLKTKKHQNYLNN